MRCQNISDGWSDQVYMRCQNICNGSLSVRIFVMVLAESVLDVRIFVVV